MNEVIYASLTSIMTESVNHFGKFDDDKICKSIADYINTIPFTIYYHDTLYEFISEYGEDIDDSYLGRDENGEKQYITYNQETNWHTRIRKELVALGYYKAYDEWAREQKEKEVA
jgi:hypothetical protein